MKAYHSSDRKRSHRRIRPFVMIQFMGFLFAVWNSGPSYAEDAQVVRTFQTWCIVDDEWKAGTSDTVSVKSFDAELTRCAGVARNLFAELVDTPPAKRYQFIKNLCMSAPGSYTSGEKILDEMRNNERGTARGKSDHCQEQAERLASLLTR